MSPPVHPSASSTLYVSPNGVNGSACTELRPCREINAALALAGPGTTVLVANGTYLGFEEVGLAGRPGAPIVVTDPGHAAVIDPNATCYCGGNPDTVYFDGGGWFDLDGLESIGSQRADIRLLETNNVTVTNCTWANGTEGSSNGANFFTALDTNTTLEYSSLYGSVSSHGAYFSDDSAADAAAYGYRGMYGDLVRNDLFFDNNWTGLQFGGALNTTVEDNVFYANGAGGSGSFSARAFIDGRVVNNLFYGLLSGGIILFPCCGTETAPMWGDLIADNTVLVGSTGRYALWLQNSVSNPGHVLARYNVVRDNILYTADGAGGWASIEYADANDTGDTLSDHNALTSVLVPNGTKYSLAQWQALGHENGSIGFDPTTFFVDPAHEDYHLAPASPARGAGVAIPAVSSDLAGNPRPVSGRTDLGCYEDTPLPRPLSIGLTGPDRGVVGEVLSFRANASGGTGSYRAYSWDFGDVNASVTSTNSTTHAYARNGSYRVTVTVTDSAGNRSSSVPWTVQVNSTLSPFSLSLLPHALRGLAPLDVNFTPTIAGGVPPVRFDWTFGDGSSSTAENPGHTYDFAGNYTATLVATDGDGRQASANESVTVRLDLHLTATVTAGTAPLPVSFTAEIAGVVGTPQLLWSFGDGSPPSTATAPTHVYLRGGNFTVNLSATDAKGNAAVASTGVRVTPLDYSVRIAGIPPVRAGETTTLTAIVDGGIAPFNLSWDLGDGTPIARTGGSLTVSHAWRMAGPVLVALYVVDAGGVNESANATVDVAAPGGSVPGNSPGLPWAAIALGLAGAVAVAGAGLAISRRKPPRNPATESTPDRPG